MGRQLTKSIIRNLVSATAALSHYVELYISAISGHSLQAVGNWMFMDKGVVQASARSQVFGYTDREHYESMKTVSKERKQACPKNRFSRKVHHPDPLINAIGQKKRDSMALLIGTIRITFAVYNVSCAENVANIL